MRVNLPSSINYIINDVLLFVIKSELSSHSDLFPHSRHITFYWTVRCHKFLPPPPASLSPCRPASSRCYKPNTHSSHSLSYDRPFQRQHSFFSLRSSGSRLCLLPHLTVTSILLTTSHYESEPYDISAHHSGTADDSSLLWCYALLLGKYFPVFGRLAFASSSGSPSPRRLTGLWPWGWRHWSPPKRRHLQYLLRVAVIYARPPAS
jgi:hypothetical protein